MLTYELQHLVDGEWIAGDGVVWERRNPATEDDVVVRGAMLTGAGLDRAVTAARRAAHPWARRPAHERGAILLAAANRIDADADELAAELSREEGKPIAEARGEVLRAAQILRFHGAAPDRPSGEVYDSPRAGERILVTRRPIGVIGVVTPFNFPLAIPAWKIAPALVHGNTVVWKPASTVPLLAMRLAAALHAAGLPAGVLNLVMGRGDLGSDLADHPGVDAMTFTGSTAVGRELAVRLAGVGKPFQGEMGGKNAAIVLADADLDVAVDQVTSGAFRSAGQKCTATSRIILEDPIADDFLERLRVRIGELVVGDPSDPGVYLGPVVDRSAQARLLAAVGDARAAGIAEIGTPRDMDPPAHGSFVPPVVFDLQDDRHAGLWDTELFGPVAAVRRARTAEHAFEVANGTEFGLSGSLFTRDVSRVLAASVEWNIGVLHVNSESSGADPHVPFGGVKQSSLGPREQGGAARDFYSETTTIYLKG